MSTPIRWGILGLGTIARAFAIGLKAVPDAKLVAVGSRSVFKAKEFAKEFGAARTHGSYEDLAKDPDVARWSGQSLSSGQLAKVYGFTDTDGSQPDAWRYLVEVQDAGKPADTTGYR